MQTKIISIDGGMRRREAELQSRLSDLLQVALGREELVIEQMADPADQVRSNADRDMAVEALNQQARSIQEIHAALAKIADGTYGLCEQCEEQIPAKRLDALPWARLCVHCQSAAEGEAGTVRMVFDHAA